MQRPSKVTPTKIPSLGVIVRLVSFTANLREELRAGCDWRNGLRHDIVKPFSAWLPSSLGRNTPATKGRRRLRRWGVPRGRSRRWNRGAAVTCRGYNQHRNVKSGEKNVEIQDSDAKRREFHGCRRGLLPGARSARPDRRRDRRGAGQ